MALPASARAGVVYGLGDAPGTFAHCASPTATAVPGTCPGEAVGGYFTAPSFRQLTAPTSAHRISMVRLFVEYDAVEQYNGSTTSPGCTMSEVAQAPWTDGASRLHPAAQSWDDLRAGLQAAAADGLTPMVVISGYGSPAAIPSWDVPMPDPTTTAGWWEYYCGVQGVLSATSKLPAVERPHVWEALNEPDGFDAFATHTGTIDPGCAVDRTGPIAGAARAACAYVLARGEILAFADHGADTVIAGVLAHPSSAYLGPYVAQLDAVLPAATFPTTWSVHDYDDVTSSYEAPVIARLEQFDRTLGSVTGGRARDLWVTEAGVLLTDHATQGGCPASGVDLGGSLGACLNGQPNRQASAAAGFFALPQAGVSVPITHLFWYQWQGESAWDSGLTDGSGQPRASWCVFFGAGSCAGSPNVVAQPGVPLATAG